MKITRWTGVWILAVGLVLFLATPLFLYLWDLDTDVVGAMIFIVGLILMIVRWKHK